MIAGCGSQGRRWLETLAGLDAEVVGLVDPDLGAAARARADFGLDGAAVGDDLAAMLARTGAEAVFDVATPGARAAVVRTGLAAGAHVLSEKPMATSLREAREIVDAAATAGRLHAVAQNRRYVPGVRRMRAFLASGAIGEPTGLHADFFLGPHFGGFREAMDHPLLLDMAIHTFDAARYVMGRAPVAVTAVETNPPGSWYAGGGSATAVFEFDDGASFTYRGSWCAEGLPTSWESAWRAIGTRGTMTWDGHEGFAAEAVTGEAGFFRPVAPVAVPTLEVTAKAEGLKSVIAEFLDAVAGGPEPETVGRDNILSLAMTLGAIESARTGRRVTLEAAA